MSLKLSQKVFFVFLLCFTFFSLNKEIDETVFYSNALTISSSFPEKVILGGNTLGFDYYGDGVLVLSNNQISEKNFSDGMSQTLEVGDVIQKIDDEVILSGQDISNYLNAKENPESMVLVTFLRDGKQFKAKVKPTFDVLTNSFKLGVWAKDNVSGLGTLTYINPSNGYFASLGHQLSEGTTGKLLPVKTGFVYDCNILGIAKGAKGVPGELRGTISKNKRIGTVEKNTQFGIFGKITSEKMLNQTNLVEVGGKRCVKPGKAQIYTSIDGDGVKPYDIQIIKTNYQSTSNAKSMVLKVVDRELIEKTGGIVQGMSGSPIVQNGKLVGALTHVFLNDSTKGFGIYIDWLI